MLPETDFTDAHRRHWEDAELLFDLAHWANADHLYGLSAECGLKAVMLSLGMNVDASGTPSEQRHRQHMPELWPVFEAFARKRGGGAYLALLPDGKPFDDCRSTAVTRTVVTSRARTSRRIKTQPAKLPTSSSVRNWSV